MTLIPKLNKTLGRVAALCVALALALVATTSVTAARTTARDREALEAAFLYQFTRYVEWPAESFRETNDRFGIAVVGDEALYDALVDVVEDKLVDNRPFETHFVETPVDAPAAHIVYFAPDFADPEHASLEALPQSAALTVSGAESFTRDGGVVRIYEHDQRLRIEINIDAAERSQLRISSKLLGLATVVRDESR